MRPTFEFVDEILKCDHWNESYQAILSCGTVYYAVQGSPNFWVCEWNPKWDHSNENYWVLLSSGGVCYAKQSGSNLSPWIKS